MIPDTSADGTVDYKIVAFNEERVPENAFNFEEMIEVEKRKDSVYEAHKDSMIKIIIIRYSKC